MTTAREVAEGLSEAKKVFILSLPKHWPNGMSLRELEGLRGFGQSGLIASRYGHDGVFHALTADGLEVRRILEEGKDG